MAQAFIKLHIAVFLAGFTGILGKLIDMQAVELVWYRMFLAAALFYLYQRLTKTFVVIPLIEILKISGVGALLALHWVFFYASVKYANVSVAVVCFSACGFFTALLEPVFNRTRFSPKEIGYSLLSLFGVALIFHFDSHYRLGILFGIACALLAALFAIANKKVALLHRSGTMLFYAMAGGLLFLTLCLPGFFIVFPPANFLPSAIDFMYLFILASACTIAMYILETQAMRHISAFTANLSFNLEPVYSIILAIAFLGEGSELSLSFYAGLALIALSVLLQTLHSIRTTPKPMPS